MIHGAIGNNPATLANRFHTSERISHLVLLTEGMRQERIAAALRNGIAEAITAGHEASCSIEEELSDVA